MPHRVTQLLRPASGNFSHAKLAAASRRHASDSDSDDHDAVPSLKKHHRLSLPFGKVHKDQFSLFHHAHFSSAMPSPASIDWSIESPPIVFHGNAQDSSGALVSGLMFLHVKDDYLDVESFHAVLNLHTTQKRPFHAHCADCQHQYSELKTWNLLAHPTRLYRGKHQFPFSVLLAGDLPATVDSPLISISYEFKAEACFVGSQSPIKFERTLPVKRSIPTPEVPHHSIRVFPPTNIKADAEYTTVIYPNSNNKLTLRLDGLTNPIENPNMIDVWKLKKLTWRLEETIKTRAPACKAHAAVAGQGNEEHAKNSATRTETRCLGEKFFHDGWKADYNNNGGRVELEFDYSVNKIKPNKDVKYACDTRTAHGTEVSHSLLVELIVSKEQGIEGKAQFATPTGTGRILRMHFNIILTEYPGLGVSWDNEAPPVYQDVPPSPPAYPDQLEFIDAEGASPEASVRESYEFLSS
ncbi:hypothetical protein B0I35DRAFT_453995 [Stachybotrys elegans]|uniref:LDB19 N-terminal domain-containing protein n=1 Tax=Stachybotrys elegans TaxID=80388 RepID=A0A8K0SHB7_9HYPO|nr:hypothetical protein B0I35DRAFT_453995 [Stachybotrys elegans]